MKPFKLWCEWPFASFLYTKIVTRQKKYPDMIEQLWCEISLVKFIIAISIFNLWFREKMKKTKTFGKSI